MNILAIIPARMGSSRFPNKPMALINGKPMIEHVFKNNKSSEVSDVIVATCDRIILNHIKSIGGNAIMTSKTQKSIDRCAEALIKYERNSKKKIDIVVMVQGDEPLIKGNMINKAIKLMKK